MKPTRERLKSARIGFSVSRGSSLTSFSLSLGIPEVDTSSTGLYILSEIPDPDSHLFEDTTGSSAPHRCRRTTSIRLVGPIKELGITPSRHVDYCRLTVTRSHHNPESQNAESRLLVADRGFLNTDSVGTGLALSNKRTIGRYGGDRRSK